LPPFQPHVNVNMNSHLGAEYFHIAQALAAGDGFANPFPGRSGPTAWMAPVLPAIEAGLLWAFGDSRDAVMAGVVLLQVNTLILTGHLVVAVVRKTTGRLAGWLTVFVFLAAVCSDFHSWFQFTHDCWLVLLALDFMVMGLVWLRPRPTWAAAIGWGLIGGFGAMVSPIVGFVWGILTLISGFLGRSTGRLRFRLAVALLTAGLVVGPWTIRNYDVFGRLIPVKSNAAYELYQSQCLQPDGLIRAATFSTHPNNNAGGRERQEYQELGEMAFLDHKREQFWQAVRTDPQNFLDRVADRLLGTTVWYVPFNADEPKRRPWAYLINRIVYPLPFLAAVFLAASAVRRPLLPVQWAVLGVYVLYLLPYVAVSFYNRYGVPLLAVNVLLMVWAVHRVASLWHKRRPIQDAAAARQRPAGVPVMARSVVFLVALTGLAAVAQSSSAGEGPEAGVLRADFRGKPFDERLFVKVIGNRVVDDEHIQIEPQGLRITLPAGSAYPLGEYGLKARFHVKGDFEIKAPFELLAADPGQVRAVGATLYIRTESVAENAMMFGRYNYRGGGGVYEASHGVTVDGKRQFSGNGLQSRAPAGKLRLVRRGAELACLAADGDSETFAEVNRLPDFGAEDVIVMRIAGQKNGRSETVFDARYSGLEIRSAASFGAEGMPLYTFDVPPSSKPGWLSTSRSAPLVLVLLVVAAILVLLAVWRRLRRQPGAAAVPNEQPEGRS
jgi:hypothetical protein